MYIETKKTGLTVRDLIESIPKVRERTGNIFPYTKEVCRCRYCSYCNQGKCSLKQCCCMEERIKAHSCTISEILRYCFYNVGDNIFLYRLRIASERATEEKSIFIDREHRNRFKKACARIRGNNSKLLAQLYLLTSNAELWERFMSLVYQDRIEYYSANIEDMNVDDYTLYCLASDIAFGSNHADITDLSNDEVVEFEVFRLICYAMAIDAFGYDVVSIADKKPKHKKNHSREVRTCE